MANLSRRDISTLERYLQMEGGHLLDFSHRTLADFFDDYGIDIEEERYHVGSGSKANKMRGFWRSSNDITIGKVLLGMIDYYDEKRSSSYYVNQDHNEDLRTRCMDIANRLATGSYSVPSKPSIQPLHNVNTKPLSPSVLSSHSQPIQQTVQSSVQPQASITQSVHAQTTPQVFQSELQTVQPQKVFIVHGHDEVLRLQVENFVRTVGLKPIVLMNQASGGNTIIEKIEEYGDADYAIVLYTPCDEGRKKGVPELNGRARQNVVFEHGYFIARLGRNKVAAMVKRDVEIQNDIQGVVYIGVDTDWQAQLLREFRKGGVKFDANALYV
ncbi:TIR domain-containing protein [Vibrio cyclitrophicus]